MSSCLSGGGRTYGFELEIVKSPSTSTQTLHTSSSSSPSSTLSESSNSPLAISTRKPRTPRKRPNQIYNEAAALLSTAYPNIFSSKHLTKNPCKFTKPHDSFYDESSELLLPFRVIDDLGIPLHHHQSTIQEKSSFRFEPKVSNFIDKSCHQSSSPIEIDSYANSNSNSLILCDGYHQDDDFDAESMLDEEIEEGIIDSIMGNLSVNNNNNNDSVDEYYSNAAASSSSSSCQNVSIMNSCYGYPMPMGLGFGGNFELGFGIRWGLRAALKPVSDEGDWWRFPAVDVGQISPKLNTTTTTTNNNNNNNNQVSNLAGKKKKKKMEKPPLELLSLQKENVKTNSELSEEKSSIPSNSSSSLLLKLNFEEVLNAWSDRGSPFSDEIQGSELAGGDIHARLAKIDLCLENGGVREASVLRYKEKRRTRLFSKKIRYQVRKVNADRRPRMKGRFVRRPNSSGSGGLR